MILPIFTATDAQLSSARIRFYSLGTWEEEILTFAFSTFDTLTHLSVYPSDNSVTSSPDDLWPSWVTADDFGGFKTRQQLCGLFQQEDF